MSFNYGMGLHALSKSVGDLSLNLRNGGCSTNRFFKMPTVGVAITTLWNLCLTFWLDSRTSKFTQHPKSHTFVTPIIRIQLFSFLPIATVANVTLLLHPPHHPHHLQLLLPCLSSIIHPSTTLTMAATATLSATALQTMIRSKVRPSVTAAAAAATAKAVTAKAAATAKAVAEPPPIVQCRWWNGVDDDSVIDPNLFVVNAGGKLKEDDLDSASLIGQEMQEKFDNVGLIHVQNTVSTVLVIQPAGIYI